MRLDDLLQSLKPYVIGWLGLWTPPMCHVTHSAGQSIAHNSVAILAFDTERYDPSGMHDTATNNSRVTIAAPGRYRLMAGVEWAANANGQRALNLKLNGTTVLASVLDSATAALGVRELVAIEYQLAAGDYIEVEVYQNSGGALNVTQQTYSPWLTVSWLGR